MRKRTQFEYAVRRRAPALADFLRYAQYEMNLDALRRKRRERAGAWREKQAPKNLPSTHRFFSFAQ